MSQSSTLSYRWSDHPEGGTLREVAPTVQWLKMPLDGGLDHINLYLLEDDDGWFVVDTGWNDDRTERLWDGIFEAHLSGKPIKGVICTHFHPDHIGQAAMITDRFRCPLYMTFKEYYQALSFAGGSRRSQSWQAADFYARAGMTKTFSNELRKMMDRGNPMAKQVMPTSFQRIEHGDVLTIGGHDWRVVVGSGHSPEHACLHCAGLRLLISGDQVLPVITSNVSVFPNEPEANPLKLWLESHERLLDLPADTLVLPAHNLPFVGVRERLRSLIDHHADRMLAIEEHCVEPRKAVELIPVLFKRELNFIGTMMALGEVIAHLHQLMHHRRIERKLHEDGAYRFTSIDPSLPQRVHLRGHMDPDDAPMMV
ncbi:MAG: MBL fold metallo-hydrolase [Gammaproteobacteria bacterium]|nr:MBL fold metallo-hydrolase [Gammaproteobacteria bacterium]